MARASFEYSTIEEILEVKDYIWTTDSNGSFNRYWVKDNGCKNLFAKEAKDGGYILCNEYEDKHIKEAIAIEG